jgi:hypothetical protein
MFSTLRYLLPSLHLLSNSLKLNPLRERLDGLRPAPTAPPHSASLVLFLSVVLVVLLLFLATTSLAFHAFAAGAHLAALAAFKLPAWALYALAAGAEPAAARARLQGARGGGDFRGARFEKLEGRVALMTCGYRGAGEAGLWRVGGMARGVAGAAGRIGGDFCRGREFEVEEMMLCTDSLTKSE